jgi:hypothetical protein
MSYFNHSFTKRFLVNGATLEPGDKVPGTNITTPVAIDAGVIISIDPNFTTADLAKFPPGYIGLFDAKTYKLYNPDDTSSSGYANTKCCPFIVAGSSLLTNDKIGPYHGGYKETNKSKVINPKYIQKTYAVESCLPEQAVLHVGRTNLQLGGNVLSLGTINFSTVPGSDGVYDLPIDNYPSYGLVLTVTIEGGAVTNVEIKNPGVKYIVETLSLNVNGFEGIVEIAEVSISPEPNENCCPTFCCEKNYYLRIDVKGSPALRFANHNLYRTLLAQGGTCCNPVLTEAQVNGGAACPNLREAICDVCTPVDPTLIYLQWAEQIVNDPYLKDFISPVVFDYTGQAWFAPGTNNGIFEWATINPDGTVTNNYKESEIASEWSKTCLEEEEPPTCCAGLRLEGAYVDTKFGNCSFQITDFFEKEPIKIYAQLVDINGDACFNQICIVEECPGKQGIGFGEQVLRDLILSESYLQNFFATDIRIREITQGSDILNAVDRNAMYDRFYIQHSVPRFNNPTGVFDNDRYLLEVIFPKSFPVNAFLSSWSQAFNNCDNCPDTEYFGCSSCDTEPLPIPVAPLLG